MKQDIKHKANEMPNANDAVGVGNPQQKYFTADEAIAFLEPRIRAMFQ